MVMKKEWWYVIALVAVIVVVMVIFKDDIGLAPKNSKNRVQTVSLEQITLGAPVDDFAIISKFRLGEDVVTNMNELQNDFAVDDSKIINKFSERG